MSWNDPEKKHPAGNVLYLGIPFGVFPHSLPIAPASIEQRGLNPTVDGRNPASLLKACLKPLFVVNYVGESNHHSRISAISGFCSHPQYDF